MKNQVEFKAGDFVYYPEVSHKILKIDAIEYDCSYFKVGEFGLVILTNDDSLVWGDWIFHATQENYELLSKRYPNVSFEPPPKRKEPKDVIQAIINSNHKFIACINKSVDVEKHPLDGMGVFSAHTLKTIDCEKLIGELVPFDLETGKVIVDFVDGKPVLEGGNE